jgi:GT2 family glycosyltransferase
MDLSILIPNHNGNVADLVDELIRQGREQLRSFEILVADDGSEPDAALGYDQLQAVPEVDIIIQGQNLGRSKTRNNLVKRARYDWILFIDSDALVVNDQFLKVYGRCQGSAAVLVGGIQYQALRPDNEENILRWRYGREIEERPAAWRNKNPYRSFSAFNFMVRKSVFDRVQFQEEWDGYGHEDTLFGMALCAHGFDILHIDNPLLHDGLEPGLEFLRKTDEGLRNLVRLERTLDDSLPLRKHIRLLHMYDTLQKLHAMAWVRIGYHIVRSRLMRNLLGRNPCIIGFQFYKLARFHQLRKDPEQTRTGMV